MIPLFKVYLGGETSISVDQGTGDSGPWSEWNAERECCGNFQKIFVFFSLLARSCGGGVLVERRTCSGQCTGPTIRYVSCNVEQCPAEARDFRSEQCSAHNDDALDGNYYKA